MARTSSGTRQRSADPEAPGHVDQLGVRPVLGVGTPIGSSAMPQIGQLPGASRTISGCIGQVYSTFAPPAFAGGVGTVAGASGFKY